MRPICLGREEPGRKIIVERGWNRGTVYEKKN